MLELTQYLIKATGTVVIYDRARAFVQQEEMKKNLAAKTQKMCGKKSKHIVREHNQETFNFGFQGNIEENASSHDCNR